MGWVVFLSPKRRAGQKRARGAFFSPKNRLMIAHGLAFVKPGFHRRTLDANWFGFD
jgi:hypothetical protein